MTKQFEDQGGVAAMDPTPILRWITSKVMTRMGSVEAAERRRTRAERARRKAGSPHRVEYFHQVDDGYSQLAAQLLRPLLEQYDVELVCHLVTAEVGRNLPEPELLLALSRYDSAKIASHYGLRFPANADAPDRELVSTAIRILATVRPDDFPEVAVAVGDALFSDDSEGLARLAKEHGSVEQSVAEARCKEGNERRAKLGHYSGATFHYGREWYWGADRFYHLERRLIGYGARRDGGRELLCPRPRIESGPLEDDGSLTLEIYPSLRSPYTSVIFEKAVQLAKDAGVTLAVRPVLPMVMRGVPVTRQKGWYVVSDSGREAAALDLAWGKIYDPIGQPVRNCYSLYAWACKHGKGNELLVSFLRAAFFEAVNTNNDWGMRLVVERAGLPWDEALGIMGNDEWQEEVEANRLAMYRFGSWGVPSFRLLDAKGGEVLALWGQDRLWLVAREIQRLLREARQGA
jgi:2-hydroxychromene-2-carboxylate isomerase